VFYELASSSWGNEEYQAIQRVIASDRLTMGENVREFERRFADKFSMQHAVMVSSGSSANLVGVAALFHKQDSPLQRGDEVIVPAISWATTYTPLQQYGLKLRFVDVDINTLNIDVSQLEKALTPKTRMVVAVSVLGNPACLDVIREFCDCHQLYLFEDNCESMGATLNQQKCGTFGDINTFSLFYSHHISTIEGGLILTNNEELYHLALSLRAHGWVRDLPEDTKLCNRSEDTFAEAYRFILPGYNARPLEISGAVGLEQLKKLDTMLGVRRRNAAYFQQCFKDDTRFIIQKENGESAWFSFTMIVHPESTLSREKVFEMLRKADIGFRMITGGNFLRHDVIQYFDYATVGEIINANIAHDRGFFVGNHPHDIRPQIDRLQAALSHCTGSGVGN